MPPRTLERLALLCLLSIACGHKAGSSEHADAAIAGGVVGCAAGSTRCGNVCCARGMKCSAGTCKYPYSTAHLYVYLCPSFSTTTCTTGFFELDDACMPVTASAGGVCYDTGFEISAGQSYQLATCTACGGACGASINFQAPAGFLEPKYFTGQPWWCGSDKCQVPSDCGGRGTSGASDAGSGH